MTRTQGNEILHMAKAGLGDFPPQKIDQALRATGDLCPADRKTRNESRGYARNPRFARKSGAEVSA